MHLGICFVRPQAALLLLALPRLPAPPHMKKAKLPTVSSSSAGHTTHPLLSLPRTPQCSMQQTPALPDPDPSPRRHPPLPRQHPPLPSLPPTSATPPLPTLDPLPTPRSNLPPENEEVAARIFETRWSSMRGHDAGPTMEAVVVDAVSKLLKAGIALSEISSAPWAGDALEGEDGPRWQAACCLGPEDEDEGGGERAWVRWPLAACPTAPTSLMSACCSS
ncbi:bromodomain-containing protein 4-like [Triticum urartu]|uniref:bromodomain-containing protein 4-like n=1 Tax=Triticum urartu TaxID=4572 RepID=UPI00204328A1|nr:bromodomain-containing protein 4-like [Triticum urartu]